jgi:hypothetical protein
MTLDEPRRAAIERYLRDATAATDQLVASGDHADEARRAIDHAVQALYRAFNGLKDEPEFWDRATSRSGETMQAVIYVRGRMEHDVLVDVHEDEILVPSEDVIPSPDLYPGRNLWWRVWPEMEPYLAPAGQGRDKRDLVRFTLAGRLIADTLRTSIEHLTSELTR